MTTAPRHQARFNTGLAVGILAGLATAGAGGGRLESNRCFFLQFPPAGCRVADLNPPGTGSGWALLVLGILVMVTCAAVLKAQPWPPPRNRDRDAVARAIDEARSR